MVVFFIYYSMERKFHKPLRYNIKIIIHYKIHITIEYLYLAHIIRFISILFRIEEFHFINAVQFLSHIFVSYRLYSHKNVIVQMKQFRDIIIFPAIRLYCIESFWSRLIVQYCIIVRLTLWFKIKIFDDFFFEKKKMKTKSIVLLM